MTHHHFPFPSPDSLERLHIHDDLIINAERWKFAHSYHRQRQNLVYQSLNQPGIVTGLGVKVIELPENVSQRGKNKRWLEIQPGIAIDINGNPIIVNSSTELLERCYPVAPIPPESGNTTIYIYIQYRDPENLEVKSISERVVEGFKLTHGFQPPVIEKGEIELCRILLEPGFKKLENPDNPLFPKINQVDLTHRIQAHCRPLAHVQVGIGGVVGVNESFKALVDSLHALFPTLEGHVCEQEINLGISLESTCDLLYLNERSFYNLKQGDIAFEHLKKFLNTGGTILIEVDVFKVEFERYLQSNLLHKEIFEFQTCLLKQPFLFTKLPYFNNQQVEIQLSQQGKVILITQPFSDACAGKDLNRSDIRVAHELGINLLYYAWQRRYLHELNK